MSNDKPKRTITPALREANRERTIKRWEEYKDLPRATHGSDKTPLKIGDIEIPCYVLNNGKRVLSGRGMQKALGLGQSSGVEISRFIESESLHPSLREGLVLVFSDPIKFKYKSTNLTHGYEATTLVDVCNLILDAREMGYLTTKKQLFVASQCEVLIRGFAKVGIIALVDEATGYQEDRDRQELQKILKTYISENLLPWTKRFPDEFYKQIFRLHGWKYPYTNRPGVVGKYTNEYVYDMLPKGVLDELREKNPKNEVGNRNYKHHQFLTPQVGNIHLDKQIDVCITLMSISDNWTEFEKLFKKRFAEHPQLLMNFPKEQT